MVVKLRVPKNLLLLSVLSDILIAVPVHVFKVKKRFKKIFLIQSNHLHLEWKCSQQTFCFQKFVDISQQCFAFTPQTNFPALNLTFHWRWRWLDQIQATFWNLFYFTKQFWRSILASFSGTFNGQKYSPIKFNISCIENRFSEFANSELFFTV